MSRPNLAARPTRDVAGVVADMMGTASLDLERPSSPSKATVKSEKPRNRKREIPPPVNTAIPLREKTSFALRPDVKRHLTELKLDLRSVGHRVTEAQIVEALIAGADAATLANLLKVKSHP